MTVSVFFLVIALILFALSAWSRWWPTTPPQQPYYPSLVSGGLFFWVLSLLWPVLTK
jgi:hypothetical protein